MIVKDSSDLILNSLFKSLVLYGVNQQWYGLEHFTFRVKKSDLSSSVPQSGMHLSIKTLLNIEFQFFSILLPADFKYVQGRSHEPKFFPFIQRKLFFPKVVAQLLQKIVNWCVTPFKTVEVIA